MNTFVAAASSGVDYSGIIAVLAGVCLTSVVGLIAWIVRGNNSTAVENARAAAHLDALEKRVERIEGKVFPT